MRVVRGVTTFALRAKAAVRTLPRGATLESHTQTERRYVDDALRVLAVDAASTERDDLERRCVDARRWLVRVAASTALTDGLDALASMDVRASLASRYRATAHTRPTFGNDGMRFVDLRLPEAMLANNVGSDLDWTDERRVLVLTGANGSGKSTFLRAVATNQVLAQSGLWCFGASFETTVVDRVGLRFGASDALVQGRSSLENELRHADLLCRAATPRTLLLWDEFAQSTDAASGARLCAATLRYLAEHCWRAGFATHYHDLATTEGTAPYTTAGFRVVPGAAASSDALRVAGEAGLPPSVLRRAAELMVDGASPAHRLPERRALSVHRGAGAVGNGRHVIEVGSFD